MIIFPEGTRSVDGELGDYKKTFAKDYRPTFIQGKSDHFAWRQTGWKDDPGREYPL